jgi:hypothetical protein
MTNQIFTTLNQGFCSYRPLNLGTSQSALSSSCFLLVLVKRGPPIRQPRTANQSKLLCLVFLTITQIWPNHTGVETFSCVFLIQQQPPLLQKHVLGRSGARGRYSSSFACYRLKLVLVTFSLQH